MATLSKKTNKTAKVVKTNKTATGKTKTTKAKAKVDKKVLDTKNVKTTVKQAVVSQREIKYKYPEELTDQLERKAWRQKVRAKLKSLELGLSRATGKEERLAKKALEEFRKEVLLVP